MDLPFRVVPVTAYQQNCTVIKCPKTNDIAVIDPGGDLDRIQQAIDELAGTPKKILLTHGHLDHVGGTLPLSQMLDVPIIGPNREDTFWIQQLPVQAQMMGLPAVQSFESSQWLEDGDQVEVGELVFDVIHCPGHTPGHVVLFCAEYRWAQVGDVLFQGSIGRTDFPKGNHQQLISSIRNKLFPLGDDIRFVPGHGPMSTFGNERQNNPFVGDRAIGASQ